MGYAPLNRHKFLSLLQQHQIHAVVDVRSLPYSRIWSDFNRNVIQLALKKEGMHYVFMGDLCGARFEDAAVYENGVLSYESVITHALFQKAMVRLKKGLKNYRIALMCAEKDPLCCHRFLLICRYLSKDINISHLRHDGALESQLDSESRLLALHHREHPSLFYSLEQRLQQAYARQHAKVFS